MIDNLQLLQGITEEDLRSLRDNNPKGFAELAKKVKEYRLQLARTNINHFIQYVMFDEVNRKPLRQAEYHIELQDHIDANRHCVVLGHTEMGKDINELEDVATTEGWKKIRDVVLGDRVFAADGSATEVIGVTRTFLDHVCYRVTFADGASVIVGEDHEWLAWTQDQYAKGAQPKAVTTKEMLHKGLCIGKSANDKYPQQRWRVPIAQAADYPKKALPIPAYVLGAWLGDGTSSSSEITGHFDDVEVIGRCSDLLGGVGDLKFIPGREHLFRCKFAGVREELAALGVLNNKHIPESYLTSSTEDRVELLRGLMDTDGTASNDGKSRVELCFTNERLAQDCLELVRSLGEKATFRVDAIQGYDHPRYRIGWTVTNINPFHLERKAARTPWRPRTKTVSAKTVTGIELVPTVPTRCIRVAHPSHTFLIGRHYTVTHNCLPLSAVLIDSSGRPQTVAELKQRFEAGEKLRVATLDPLKKRYRHVPVKSVFFDSNAHCIKVFTDNGRETIVSYNHPFKVVTGHKTKRLEWRAAGDLKKGMVVITTDQMPRPEAKVQTSITPEDAFVMGFLLRFGHSLHLGIKRGETFEEVGLPVGRVSVIPDAGKDHSILRIARKICERYGWQCLEAEPLPHRQRAHTKLFLVGAVEWLASKGMPVEAVSAGLKPGNKRAQFKVDGSGPVPADVVADETLAEAFATGYLLQEPLLGEAKHCQFGVPATMAQSMIRLFNRCGVSVTYIRATRRRLRAPFTSRMVLKGPAALRLFKYTQALSADNYDQHWADALAKLGVSLPGKPQLTRPKHHEPQIWEPATILRVEAAGKMDVYGVEIDDPSHTHLTDGFLTHNTQQVSIARPLFELGRNPNLRIAIIQSTGVLARDILRSIAGHIENNPRLHEVFPALTPGDLWTQTALSVTREYGVKDPSIQVRGAFSKILGVRIDRLIADDILTLDYTRTKHMRDRMREWFISELMSRLTAESRVCILGNAWHIDDLHHELMKNERWAGLILPVRDPITGISRWPEVWSQERIADFEALRTPAEAARALDCIAWSDEASRFRNEWFTRAITRGTGMFGYLMMLPSLESIPVDDKGRPTITGTTYSGVDLAFSDKARSDWNVIFTIMVGDDGHNYLLNIERGRWSSAETVDRIIDTHVRYGSIIFVESVSAQRVVIDWCNDKKADVPVYPFNTRGQGETHNKWHGIFGVEMVAAGLANNKWSIPRSGTADDPGPIDPLVREWMDECRKFSAVDGAHSGDILMASWICVRGASLFGGDYNMSAIDATSGPHGEGDYVASTRMLTSSEVRNRIGEAIYASIDLEPPDGAVEGTVLFDI